MSLEDLYSVSRPLEALRNRIEGITIFNKIGMNVLGSSLEK